MAELNLIHRVKLPVAALDQRLPAVVMVHGWSGNETVMDIFGRTIPPQAVVVSPRAPVEVEPGSFGWFKANEGAAGFESGLSALREFVVALPSAYPVDPARILLMGFSQGTAMSYALQLNSPALAAGVAGLAGFLPDEARQWLSPGRLAGKFIFVAHGGDDMTVPVDQARAAAGALKQTGALVEYHEYPIAHKLSAQGLRDLKIWLAARIGSPASA